MKGQHLLEIARYAVTSFFKDEKYDMPDYPEKRGVFVTITIKGELRGCIGYTHAIYPLSQAVFEAARAAAFDDPRFSPVEEGELEKLEFEVTVLTPPTKFEANPSNVKVGTDGLLVSMYGNSGLLLPQVPVEQGWDAEEFLDNTCIKAGLPPKSWKEKDCEMFKFQGEIFSERHK